MTGGIVGRIHRRDDDLAQRMGLNCPDLVRQVTLQGLQSLVLSCMVDGNRLIEY